MTVNIEELNRRVKMMENYLEYRDRMEDKTQTQDEKFIDSLLASGEYEKRDVICAKTGKTLKDVIVCKAD